MVNELGRDTLTQLPTFEQRKVLQNRFLTLETSLRPVDYSTETKKRAGAALALMFAGYDKTRSMKDDNRGTEKRKLIGTYVVQLSAYPVFAVEMACDDICQGRVPEAVNFVPSVPLIAKLAREHAIEPQAERAEIKRILAVKDVRFEHADNPEMVERIRKGFEELAVTISTNDARAEKVRQDELAKATIERNRQQVLRMQKAAGIVGEEGPAFASKTDNILISPTLLKKQKAYLGRQASKRTNHEG